jgi:hypothetical protein
LSRKRSRSEEPSNTGDAFQPKRQKIAEGSDLNSNLESKESDFDPDSGEKGSRWHIYEAIPKEGEPEFSDRHSLSQALDSWSTMKVRHLLMSQARLSSY